MPVGRALFGGSPYVGVYLRACEATALAPPSLPIGLERDVIRLLGVRLLRSTVLDSEVVGALVAANSHGVIVGEELDPEERAILEELAPVTVVRHRHNAMGNNVLVNDSGAIVHPEFSDHTIAEIGRALRVPAHRGTVAGLGTVGMAALATNKGVIVHPKATEREANFVAQVLGVPVHRSTANFGVPIVGACVAANSRGFIVGRPTTPVEIVHLQDGLGILD